MRGKGEGSLFKDSRGLWNASIELPSLNGDRRRKVVRSKDKRTVMLKLREMQAELERTGDLPTADMTVEAWMNYWLDKIQAPKLRPKTLVTYRGLVQREVIAQIGAKRLGKLTPADVRNLLTAMVKRGLSPTTAAQVHRILSVALKYAVREGKVGRNVASLVDAPRRAVSTLQALELDEAIRLLDFVKNDRLGSLWAAVLLTGGRQGELCGLETNRVGDYIDMSWQLQRIRWEHGCEQIGVDEKKKPLYKCERVRGAECPKRRIDVPADFEHRQAHGGLWWTRPKTRSGWRIIPLVDPLRAIIATRLDQAAAEPNPHGLVWTTEAGAPIDPHMASRMWDQLLKDAGLPDVRFHDGRHTTVDLLLAAGVPEELIAEIVGHSNIHQTRAYKSKGNIARLTAAMESLSDLFSQRDGGRSDKPGAIAS